MPFSEWEKAQAGCLYDANQDVDILSMRTQCADLCYAFNQCLPSNREKQRGILLKIFGDMPHDVTIESPFHCDYGTNIVLGNHFYANHNLTILDGAKVTIGEYVFIGPNCVLSTASHAFDVEQRNAGLEVAQPITIGNNVWIGANCTILMGVSIGDDSIVGAGSVVTKDIPCGVIAAGNPCRVIRKLTNKDKEKYTFFKK